MGAGASATKVTEELKGATDEQIQEFVKSLDEATRAKLRGALEPASEKAKGRRALIVSTSADKLGDHATGAWSEEICGPYFTFKDAGLEVKVCSVGGGDIPIDAGSLSDDFKTAHDKRMIEEEKSAPLKGTPKLTDIDVTTFDIVFFAGGHGTCVDFPTESVGEVVSKAWAASKVLAFVCHGPTALVEAKSVGGEPLVRTKKMTCFSDVEEDMVKLKEKVPFLLEEKMKALGAQVEVGQPWSSHVVSDGKLVTGQNPQSSVACAKECLAKV